MIELIEMSDIMKALTPDFKRPGQTKIGYLDLGNGKNRLGGSICPSSGRHRRRRLASCGPQVLGAVSQPDGASWRAPGECDTGTYVFGTCRTPSDS